MEQAIYIFTILATLGGDVEAPETGHYSLFSARAESGEAYHCEAHVFDGDTLEVQCSPENDGNDANEFFAQGPYENGVGSVMVDLPGMSFALSVEKK